MLLSNIIFKLGLIFDSSHFRSWKMKDSGSEALENGQVKQKNDTVRREIDLGAGLTYEEVQQKWPGDRPSLF